jgi:hypothetical protein
MAAPLPKEDKAKILGYLRQLDLPSLTGVKIKELVKENLGIDISQPTASKLKGEILRDLSYGESDGDGSSLRCPTKSEEIGPIVEPTRPYEIRRLSQKQMSAIDSLLQGQSDRAVAEALGMSREMVWDWRNNDPFFIAELNRQRVELWIEARERLKSLANRALDVVEQQLNSDDPKAALAAAKYVLQGTRLLGDTDLSMSGPTTPEDVILGRLRREAREEVVAKNDPKDYNAPFFGLYNSREIDGEVDALAQSRLKNAMIEAGIS